MVADTAGEDVLGDHQDWKYLGEGEMHVVLRHRSTSVNVVLRLRKANREHRTEAPPGSTYARRVIAPLLGEAYIPPTEPVSVVPGFIAALGRNIADMRPTRHAAGPLDLRATQCTLERDLTLLPTSGAVGAGGGVAELSQLCFELKPKAATLPAADALDGAWPLPLCRFCALQLGRLRADRCYRRSCFCPLALFSGDQLRVRAALEELVLRPQNNLGIFVDGVLTYGKGVHDVVRLLDVLESQLAPLAALAAPAGRHRQSSYGGGGAASGERLRRPSTRAFSEISAASDLDELLGISTGDFELIPEESESGSVARKQDADDALSVLCEHERLQAVLPEIHALQAERARAALPSVHALVDEPESAPVLDDEEADAERLATHGVLRLYLRAVEAVLLREPLLPRLRAAQAAADPHGIEAVRRAYERLLALCGADERRVQALIDSHARRLCGLPSNRPAPTAAAEAAPRVRAGGSWGEFMRAVQPARTAAPPDDPPAVSPADVALVHDWLLSLTLRDCSLMLCLRALLPAPGHSAARQRAQGSMAPLAEEPAPAGWAGADGSTRTVSVRLDAPDGLGCAEVLFAYSLGVVDVELKPCSKVPKHVREAKACAQLAEALRAAPTAAHDGALFPEAHAVEALRTHMLSRPCAREALRGSRATQWLRPDTSYGQIHASALKPDSARAQGHAPVG